ncbi:MAG: ammonia-forming cytochrome c nitrite reductase subunit c552, partial [Planctomycetes bacterium]|nr:ammonia-forming cytochrome c nitrite reductase subunit c552 [Planctomycetota bacterium]
MNSLRIHIPCVTLVLCQALLCAGRQTSSPESGLTESRETVTSAPETETPAQDFAGSSSCRECHENFYQLWAPSHHGLAMQPYTEPFAQANLTEHADPITVGAFQYQAAIGPDLGLVLETGPEGIKKYPIEQVLGGKNVYYFLTPWLRGRLQTLPLAYNVNTKSWFDTAESGVRHFPGNEQDERVHWTDPLYTFNTSCYDCHVSQLASNYNLETDTYRTEWAEAGINCETCHGPSQRHVENYQRAAKTGIEPNELGLISTRTFNHEQTNGMCNSCHAKMSPITASFQPSDRYFDHFDLITLDNPDFYPDGRDLGENYTMTSWRMSGCFKSGQLDCVYCHTSSGRYRFSEPDNALGACLPCHQSQADNFKAHTHHERNDKGPVCISCHMPMTSFAHMNRSDHSMRPPLPGVSAEFKSDIACLLCHTDKKAAWADKKVREWKGDTFQQPYLAQARLLDQARHGLWKNLDTMLATIQEANRDEIYATSFIRTLVTCEDNRKWPVLIDTLKKDPSPLVRSAAATALDGYYVEDA